LQQARRILTVEHRNNSDRDWADSRAASIKSEISNPMKLQLAAALAAVAFAGAALAQPPAGGGGGQAPSPEMQAARQAMMQACAADMKTLCDGKQGREAFMCLRDNADKASAPCKDAMSKMPARRPPPAG
jgi:hypothetical protein